jgi:hypothetical protein
MIGLILLVLAGGVGLSWWHLLQGRERARAVAAAACREHGLVLMDDTVVFDGVSYRTVGAKRLFSLQYRFEFAYQGVLHKGGKVLISRGFAATVLISTANGDLIEEY